tara:strand:- start:1583 stop:2230 length:648 start_codon:yes stop_codon:yes gene_type:complete
MSETEAIIERLKEVYEVKTNKELSLLVGLAANGAHQWKARNVIPYREIVQAHTEKGISMEWLLNGTGDKYAGSNTSKLLPVPHYAIQASAGGGSLVEAEPIEQHLTLSREWLSREGIVSKDLIGIYARGDSMEPSIISGDSLLIDREANVIGSDGGIYVINYEGDLFVKRVQKLLDGRIAVTSDNKKHMSIEISKHDLEHLKIIGRVVWFGRKII